MAVGVNGEIGYIAVAESAPMVIAPTTELSMPLIHSSTLVSPAHLAMAPTDVDLQKSGNVASFGQSRTSQVIVATAKNCFSNSPL